MFSCTNSALIHAVKKGHLATWPCLAEEAINKYLKLTPATTMGHMNQKRQNIRSTKKKVISESEDEDITPQGSGEKNHLFFAVVLDQGQIYTDLTGTFPARSSKGNNVMMVCYSYDATYIRPIAMNYKSGAEWVRKFGIAFDEMTSKGFKPKLQTMDNEASAALKKYFTEKEMNYQLPPRISTELMLQRGKSVLSKNNSNQASLQCIRPSPFTHGKYYCPRQKSH
jgi:hypothetical protein